MAALQLDDLLRKTELAFGWIENMDVLGSLAKLSEGDVFAVNGLAFGN